MGKRFTDTDLWQKPWFMNLSRPEKVAWFYIKDHCDCVGVWTPNTPLADFVIGEPIDWEAFRERCNGNIELLENGKWFLSDFCFFQYGELTETCKPHQKYIADLSKHGLLERVSKGYTKGMHTPKEKEQEKEEEQEETGGKTKFADYVSMKDVEYNKLVEKYGKPNTDAMITKLNAYKGSKGKKYKSDYLAILNWVVDEIVKPDQKIRARGADL